MEDLIAKLERATEGSAELDNEIKLAHAAYLISSGADKAVVIRETDGDLYADARPYTRSYDAAMRLKPEGLFFALGDANEADTPWACLTDADGRDFSAEAATPIIALCIAGLKALADRAPT